jgi:O-antigen/teichoic acid export membrane protein
MFVCRVAMIAIAVAGLGLGVWGVLGASIATAAVFGVVLNLREFWHRTSWPDMHLMREVARFALPFVPGGLCFFVIGCGDRFFLVKSAGAEELGVYALGCKLASAVAIFSFTPFFKVWSARMYDAFALPDAAAVVGRACTRMLGAYVLVGLGLCLFVDDVVAVLASSQYAGATAVVAPLVLAAFFGSANTLMDGVFYAHRKTYPKPWIAFVAMLVMCGLFAWLIPQFGAMGAACAILGGNVFLAAATWTVSQRIFRVHYEYARMAAMLIGAAALLFLGSRFDFGIIMNIPAKLTLWTVLPALLWVTGLVSTDEKAMTVAAIRHVGHLAKRFFFAARQAPPLPAADAEKVV